MKRKLLLLLFALSLSGLGWGQTTVSYDFSAGGAVTGLNQAAPGISLDANIGFGSFKNSGTSNPALNSGQLRLYQNATKGGSIKIYASNGVTITKVVVVAASSGDGAGPAGYSVDNTTEVGTFSGGGTMTMNVSATNYVEFYNKGNSSSTRTYVNSFEVTYTAGATTYTVTYDGNGSTGGTAPTDPNSPYASGATVTVLGNTGSLVKTGFTFNNWNTAANGSGTPYSPAATFSIAANTILYAQWVVPEPTNHATDFSATANSSSQITVTWTDATAAEGEQLPSAYLVKASTGTPTAPADGTAEADGTLIKNISQGTEEAVFTGLDASTTYNFAIWPYTNSGTAIDYKLGSEPTTSGTTLTPLGTPVAIAATDLSSTGFTANWNAAAGATSYRLDVSEYETFATSGGNMTDLIISEYVEGSSYNKGIELFNGTGSSVDLSSYSLMKQTNGAGDFGSELTLTGTLENNITLVIILNQASQELLNYADLVTNSSCINFNGNDAVALYKSGVQIDVVGVVDQVTPDWGANVTLVRKSSISSPTINYSSDDWDSYSEDTFSHLGSHTFSGGSTPSYVTGYENLTVAGTSQTVSNLTPNTTYYYRVRATDGVETSVNSNTISASTDASAASTYTGTGNWSEVGNWSAGLPGATTNVTVNGTLTVDDIVECNNLTISTSGAVTVTADQGLSINGDFLIQSSAAGTGSFIAATADYDITGSTTVQRYLSKYDAAGDSKYHFISSPVAAQAIFTDLTDLYRYSEVTNYWINRTSSGDPEAFGDENFVVGRGYLVANVADVTKVFTGTLNSYLTDSPLVLIGTNTPDKGEGWNLFGNPFPSAIDWDEVAKGDGMDNALYYYDAAEQNYRYYINIDGVTVGSGSRYIPSMQGFMVHAKTTDTKTISIDNGDRVHEAQTVFYKAATAIPGSLSLKVSAGDYEDVAFIHFNEGATTQFDGAYDAYKLSSYNTLVPMIYTQSSNNEDLAINGLPELTEELAIPVYFVPGTEGIQTLTANLEGLTSTVVYLKDNKTNTTQNLTQNPTYSFTATEGDNPDRFLLHFGIVGIEDNTSNLSQINAYAYQNQLYVQSNLNEARVSLFDIQGHQLLSREINGAGSSRIPLDLPSGIYIVRLQSNNQVKNVKVFIN